MPWPGCADSALCGVQVLTKLCLFDPVEMRTLDVKYVQQVRRAGRCARGGGAGEKNLLVCEGSHCAPGSSLARASAEKSKPLGQPLGQPLPPRQ